MPNVVILFVILPQGVWAGAGLGVGELESLDEPEVVGIAPDVEEFAELGEWYQ